jgi:hypothetical protein
LAISESSGTHARDQANTVSNETKKFLLAKQHFLIGEIFRHPPRWLVIHQELLPAIKLTPFQMKQNNFF